MKEYMTMHSKVRCMMPSFPLSVIVKMRMNPKSKLKQSLRIILSLLISAGLLWLALRNVEFARVRIAMDRAGLVWLFFAAVDAMIVNVFLASWQ